MGNHHAPTLQGLPAGRALPPSVAAAAWDAAKEAAAFLACAKREYLIFSSRVQPRQALKAALCRSCEVPRRFCNRYSWLNTCQPFAHLPFVLEWPQAGLLILHFVAVCCFKTRFRHSWVLCWKRPDICLAAILLSLGLCPFTSAHSESLENTRSMNVLLVRTTRCSTASKNLSVSGSSIACCGTVSQSWRAKASS